jgi:hypothetical protein
MIPIHHQGTKDARPTPGRPTTAGNRWARKPPRKQAFVPISWPSDLRSASAGLATSLLHSMAGKGTPSFPKMKEKKGRTDAPQARQSVRSAATTNARVRSSRASHRRQAIIRSPVVLPSISGTITQTQPSLLCVFASLRGGWAGGLCVLCGSMGWMGGSVFSLCLCFSAVQLS